jgi:UDP-N-acetyl-D-mannosaminuronate dehydrogenase
MSSDLDPETHAVVPLAAARRQSEENRVPLSVVIGLGEVGRPMLELIEQSGHPVVGIDVNPVDLPARGTVGVAHVCIPFEIPNFVGEVSRYIELLDPELTVIGSTVAVCTTRAVAERSGGRVVHSPIRGKHARMLEELQSYVKFVGAMDSADADVAVAHFQSLGLETRSLSSPEATELAKLTETTYFGVLIAWAQEVERYCDRVGADYDEVSAIFEEIGFLPPVKYEPGVIGGHCVMPNIEILRGLLDTPVLDAIRWSNATKVRRERLGRQRTREAS